MKLLHLCELLYDDAYAYLAGLAGGIIPGSAVFFDLLTRSAHVTAHAIVQVLPFLALCFAMSSNCQEYLCGNSKVRSE